MAIFSNAGRDIINGAAVIQPPSIPGVALPGSGYIYDPGQPRSQHFPSGDSLLIMQTLNSRYLYHGGVGGSGNWEH